MQVVQVLAGFTLGGADILRRAIGKKKVDVLAKQKEKFTLGCKETNNIDEKLADQIWEKIKLFAGYGFNKSHSAAYGFVCYQTAYLKANYPVEFMAAILNGEIESADRIAFMINTCREMEIKILPPDVNSSLIQFGVADGAIRFGLGAIKGVGEVAAAKIIDARKRDGQFKSFQDFCERCGSAVNARMMEHLTRAGAFDSLGLRRSQILAIAEPMLKYSATRAADLAQGQGSLFDMLDEEDSGDSNIQIPDIPEFSLEEILENEKQLLGFYVTGHPFDRWAPVGAALTSCPVRDIDSLANNTGVRLVGMVDNLQLKFSKNSGKQFGILMLEDLDSAVECMIYERALNGMARDGIELKPGMPIMIEAVASKRDENEKAHVVVDKVCSIDNAMSQLTEMYIHVDGVKTTRAELEQLKKIFAHSPGKTKLVFCVVDENDAVTFVETSSRSGYTIRPDMLEAIDTLLGPGHFRFKAEPFDTERAKAAAAWRANRAAENAAKNNG